jgi:MFS family permease
LTPWLLGLLSLFAGASAAGWHGIYIALLSELALPDRQGRTVAFSMQFAYVGITSGPPLFGLTVDLTGAYAAAWLGLTGAALLAVILVSRVREAA